MFNTFTFIARLDYGIEWWKTKQNNEGITCRCDEKECVFSVLHEGCEFTAEQNDVVECYLQNSSDDEDDVFDVSNAIV